jgi:dTDP-4-amino-4,6-dideoxygalactose transaminase
VRHRIPLSKPFVTGKELEYISKAISGGAIASEGEFTRRCSDLLEQRFGVRRALMTPSCTAALEMAVMLGRLEAGDEVILPSFTFVSSANAIMRAGARPVFVDIRTDTLNIDESLIPRALTPRTRAIMPVHYAGVSCEMDEITSLAEGHNLLVIEDAAQGVNSYYKGRALGTIGHLGAYSFHDTKNYTCGEGGALCVNDEDLIERAEIIREKGTNRSQFSRGEIDKYTWVDTGSSYIPSEIACAFLCAQLEAIEAITKRRHDIYKAYRAELEPLARDSLVGLPVLPEGCESNSHLFFIVLRNQETRDALMTHLRRHEIQASFHYVPLHSSKMGRSLGYQAGDLPVTEEMSGRMLRLPLFNDLRENEQARIIDEVRTFLKPR